VRRTRKSERRIAAARRIPETARKVQERRDLARSDRPEGEGQKGERDGNREHPGADNREFRDAAALWPAYSRMTGGNL
jgi:hypothetical protein